MYHQSSLDEFFVQDILYSTEGCGVFHTLPHSKHPVRPKYGVMCL